MISTPANLAEAYSENFRLLLEYRAVEWGILLSDREIADGKEAARVSCKFFGVPNLETTREAIDRYLLEIRGGDR